MGSIFCFQVGFYVVIIRDFLALKVFWIDILALLCFLFSVDIGVVVLTKTDPNPLRELVTESMNFSSTGYLLSNRTSTVTDLNKI